MPIYFDENRKLFHLHNDKFSYYFYIHRSGMPVTLYFGAALSDVDISSISRISPDWYSHYYDHESGKECVLDDIHLNCSGFLTPQSSGADTRPNFLIVEGNKNNKLDLRYVSHRIYKGKPTFSCLPYVRDDSCGAETVELTLKDFTKDIYVLLSLSVFDGYNVIIRNTKVINKTGKSIYLKKCASLSQDFFSKDFDIIHFPGEWCFERQLRRERLTEGTKVIEATAGRSSHEHNPFIFISSVDANEDYGDVYGFSFLYSGSFKCEACVYKTGTTRITLGMGDLNWKIDDGEHFDFPEGLMIYGKGFTSVSLQLHDLIRSHIIKDGNPSVYKSILLNSWEGCYLDFDTDRLIGMVDGAKRLGAQLFVLDDGWFGDRDEDDRSLGDWFVNDKKVDIDAVIKRCHDNGMKFGLWIEPEMANFDSELIKSHIGYVAVDVNTDPYLSRHQVPLDFANPEVVDTVYSMLEKLLSSYPIEYVKWDHNRLLDDCYSGYLGEGRQGEFYHANILGYYRLAKMLTERFPNVHFQGCSSGGGRFDLGTLFYFPEIWTSDENDPVQRLFIQYGTSFAYPPCVMGAHVNDSLVTGYKTKAEVAFFGSYGFELDPKKIADSEVAEIKNVNEIFKKYHDNVVIGGDFYRLTSPFDGKAFAVNAVSKDKSTAIALYVNLLKRTRQRTYLKLKGLEPSAIYRCDFCGTVMCGEYFMNVGVNLSEMMEEFKSYFIILEKV